MPNGNTHTPHARFYAIRAFPLKFSFASFCFCGFEAQPTHNLNSFSAHQAGPLWRILRKVRGWDRGLNSWNFSVSVSLQLKCVALCIHTSCCKCACVCSIHSFLCFAFSTRRKSGQSATTIGGKTNAAAAAVAAENQQLEMHNRPELDALLKNEYLSE